MEFTIDIYYQLLKKLIASDYLFQSFSDYLENPFLSKSVILRHDIDKLPQNALRIAAMENELGIKATYYFRIVKHVFDEEVIREIAKLGHEIGYHYEDLSLTKGDLESAIISFERNINSLRNLYPIRTICMHGSPLSSWDNISLWETYDYHKFGIIGEPYLDIDYSKVLYITDTGRAWNKGDVSVRDKVKNHFNINIKNTNHLFQLIENNALPLKIIINTHPQRWFDPGINWAQELIMQSVKNVLKSFIVKGKRIIII